LAAGTPGEVSDLFVWESDRQLARSSECQSRTVKA
jgi:hypothetical protein